MRGPCAATDAPGTGPFSTYLVCPNMLVSRSLLSSSAAVRLDASTPPGQPRTLSAAACGGGGKVIDLPIDWAGRDCFACCV